ncbi:hypothetical protein ACWF9B_35555 [Streptomyces sp. NPDC055089]
MWWVGFEGVTWTGESEPTWYETFEGEAKRGFCPTCGSRIAAISQRSASTSPPSTTPAVQTLCPSTHPSAATACTGCPRWRCPGKARPASPCPPAAHPFGDPDQDPGLIRRHPIRMACWQA